MLFKTWVDEGATLSLLGELVKINSVNSSLVPGAQGEAEIAEYIAGYLRSLGLEVRVEEVRPGRCNAVGIFRGSGGGRSLMLNGHTDTVGIEYMTIDPLKPVVREGKMYGRGTHDMKGGLVSSLASLRAVIDSGTELRGDVIFAAVCDEEYASIGTERVMEATRVDAAIVGESTELMIERCHKGFAWIDIESRGVAAHGSKPEKGVDAISKMGNVLTGIEDLGASLITRRHPLVGSASVHSSIIKGGNELSTYPDRCLLQVERRLIPGEVRGDVEVETEALLRRVTEKDPKFNGSYKITFYRGPMDVPEGEEICQTLLRCSEEAIDLKPVFTGGTGWLDTQIIWEKGIPAVAYGPVGEGDHAAVEWVDIKSVIDAAKVQELAIKRFCGVNEAN